MKNLMKISLGMCLFMAINTSAQTSKTVTGFNHMESVVVDGKFIYAADIGKELNPTAKDGDGQILKLDKKGQILDATFVKEKLDAPKGLAINKDILFINDIDRLLAIDLKTGTKLYEIDFSKDTSFLNDIVVWDSSTLYISATDKSKLYKVNLIDKSYSEIKTDVTISGINGLFCYKKASRIYVNGFGSKNKANGVIGFINLKDNTFNRITNLEGHFDGIFISKDVLYVSNWVDFEKKGTIQGIGIYGSNRVSTINISEPIAGPADFIIENDQLIVPGMISGEIRFIKLDSDLYLKL
jgi:hypothetical protein